ncbi:MAG: T9SS type A sorting domain-containing protein [Cytophagales bacterium]|nr:T9SS type A sorting domain-containing protein [Cytophagales bacterium]
MQNPYIIVSRTTSGRMLLLTLALLALAVTQSFAQSMGGPSLICQGDTSPKDYYLTSGGSASYWSASNGTIISQNAYSARVVWGTSGSSGSITAYFPGSTYPVAKVVSFVAPLKVAYMTGANGMGICRLANTSTTFTHPAVSGASGYNWSSTNGLLFPNGQTTFYTTSTSVTVTAPTSTTLGSASITVTPSGGCGGTPLTRTLTVEDSPIPISSIKIYKQGFSTTDSYMCPNTTYTIRVEAPTARSRTNWTVSGNYSSYYIGTDFVDVTTTSTFQYLNVGVTVTNSCSQTTTLSQNFFKGYSCSSFMMSAKEVNVYPNPGTGNEVTVAWPAAAGASSVELLDWSGKVIEKVKPENGQVTFKTSKLSNGTYYVHVRTGSAVIRKRLQVKK